MDEKTVVDKFRSIEQNFMVEKGGIKMSRRQSQGQCFFCKTVVCRQAMIKHLQSCDKMPPKDSNIKRYLYILVEGQYDPVY